LIDYLNDYRLKKVLKSIQDAIIDDCHLRFEDVENFYTTTEHKLIRPEIVPKLQDMLNPYMSPQSRHDIIENLKFWQDFLDAILEDSLCSPLAEIYKQYMST
jgi:hypothetical protein